MSWRRTGRTLVELVLALSLLLGASYAQVATTTVTETVYHADGSAAGGTLLVSWPSFTAANGASVPAGSTSLTIGAGGAVSATLAPNAGATPMGTYYTVVYHLDDGSTTREYWVVPVSAYPVQVSTIKSSVLPLSVAMQTVSKAYVDTAIATAELQPVSPSRLPALGASGAGHAAGLTPDPGAVAGATSYLREDGIWTIPTGGLAAGAQCEFVYAGGSGGTWPAKIGAYTTTLPSGSQSPTWVKGGLALSHVNNAYAQVTNGCLSGAQTVMVFYTADAGAEIAQNVQFGIVASNYDLSNSNFIHVSPGFPNQGPAFGGTVFGSEDRATGTVAATFTFGSATGSNKVYLYDRPLVSQYVQSSSPIASWSSVTGQSDYLGSWMAGGGYGFSGVIHAIAAWPRALTEAEIRDSVHSIASTLLPYGVIAKDTTDYGRGVVIANGDSITECNVNNYAYNGCILNQAMDSLGTDQIYYNVGQFGFTSTALLSEYPTQVSPIFKQYSGPKRMMVLDVGSNDIGTDVSATAVLSNIGAECGLATAEGVSCALGTIMPRGDFTPTRETQRQLLNAGIVAGVLNGTLNAVSLTDWAGDPIMGNVNTVANATYFKNDQIHPLPPGATILARYHALAIHRMMAPETPYWMKMTVNSAAFAGVNASSYTMPLLQLMPREKVCGISARVGTGLSGTGLTALTGTLGNSLGTTTTYGGSFNALATGVQDNGLPATSPAETGVVQANWTATGANLSAVSAGSVDFDICVVTQP